MMWFIWIPLFIIILVVALKIFDNKNISAGKNQGDSPLEILKRRYANGEMSTEEYEERKKILEK